MVLVRKIHNRGANIVVEAHAEVLFAPTGEIGRWTGRFSRKVTGFAAGYAPVNKRPRWGHYGKPLRSTFTSATRFQPGRMKVYAAIGSTSPHAYYVDQGTGIYNGSGPYEAKVLPPWVRGSPSLYERTWRPGGPPNPQVKPVMIKGQRGQGFFDKGLKRGFQFMRMRSYQLPAEGRIGQALSSFPTGLANFAGNTSANPAFLASLTEWREWRDAAFKASEQLGKNHKKGFKRSQALAAQAAVARARQVKVAGQIKREADLAALARAAERRAEKQKRALAAEKKKREEGERKRKEKEAKATANESLIRGNAASKRTAMEFYRLIKKQYPNAVITQGTLSDGVIVYTVKYTTNSGDVVRQRWAYGYAT